MANIITSRTRQTYSRLPGGPVRLNTNSSQSVGLVAWWPLLYGIADLKDYSGQGNTLSLSGAPTTVASPDGGFAVDFSGTNQFLTRSSAPLSALPLTMACWFNNDVDNTTRSLISVGLTADQGKYELRAAGATTGDPVSMLSGSGGGVSASAVSSTGFTAGAWFHATGVVSATNARAAFKNGSSKGTNTASITAPSLTGTRIAASSNPLLDNTEFAGLIQHACIWNRALSDAEVFALYDPDTRWDLYAPSTNVVYSFGITAVVPPGGAPVFNASWAKANTFMGAF